MGFLSYQSKLRIGGHKFVIKCGSKNSFSTITSLCDIGTAASLKTRIGLSKDEVKKAGAFGCYKWGG